MWRPSAKRQHVLSAELCRTERCRKTQVREEVKIRERHLVETKKASFLVKHRLDLLDSDMHLLASKKYVQPQKIEGLGLN